MGKDACAGECSHPEVPSHHWVNRGSHTEHGFSPFRPADLTVLWSAGGLFQTDYFRHLKIIVSVIARVPHTTMDNQSYAVKHFGLPSIAILPCVVMLCASLLRLSCMSLETELSVPHMCRTYTQLSDVTSVPHSNPPHHTFLPPTSPASQFIL